MTYEEALDKLAPDGYKISGFTLAKAAAELYAEHRAISFMDSIRDYEKEARIMIGFDERATEELYNTFNKTQP